jgi:hypothetical protein
MAATEEVMSVSKYNALWGTIMICIIYASIALMILLGAYFTEIGKTIFIKNLSVFTTTFIIGTILIIIIVTSLVIDWKPDENKVLSKEIIGPLSCPDYWNMTKNTTDETNEIIHQIDLKKTADGELSDEYNAVNSDDKSKFRLYQKSLTEHTDSNLYYTQYLNNDNKLFYNKCKNNVDIINDRYEIHLNSSNEAKFQSSTDTTNAVASETTTSGTGNKQWNNYLSSNDNIQYSQLTHIEDKRKFLGAMLTMTAEPNDSTDSAVIFDPKTSGLKCNEVYPEYLERLDAEEYAINNFQGKSNKYRCEYANVCDVSWSAAGC